MRKKKRTTRSGFGNAIAAIFLLLMGVFIALPIYYSIINAFKPTSELFLFPPRFVVYEPTFQNFLNVVRVQSQSLVPVERYLFNSVFITIVGTAGYVLIASMAAYPMAKRNFPGKKVIYYIVVFAILFRPEVTSLPQYMMMSKFNMLDTYWALIFPLLATSFGVFLMMQFMSTVPDEILEAARIDGAGEKYTFFHIVLPTVKPALLTLTIFNFVSAWSTAGSQFTYSETMKLLPTMLSQISTGSIMRAGVTAAGTVLLMLPSIIVFAVCQGSVIETMTHSGIKS
ncbi:MAG: carbohydrate ABC transporter permease [Clostridia bacterium]|nr:carbohydrate ABC transporter permease [Clostridia bacterium]